MTDPIRAALERLHQYAETFPVHDTDEIVAAARAALARPGLEVMDLTDGEPPLGPFSEDDLRQQWNQQADKFNQWDSLESSEQLAWAQVRAIAADRARWGHPTAPAAPAAGEVAKLTAEIQHFLDGYRQIRGLDPEYIYSIHRGHAMEAHITVSGLTRAAALLEQLSAALHPVPVSEHPWEREGWCDSEGMCWWWNPPTHTLGTGWWGLQPWEWMVDATVCLPAHALPHPTTTPAGQEGADG